MADGNGNSRRPRLLDASGGALRDDSDVVGDVGLLHAQVLQLRGAWTAAQGAINVHQAALVELTAVVRDLERRSLRGRIRRAIAWGELAIETLHGYAMELGLVKVPLALPELPVATTEDTAP